MLCGELNGKEIQKWGVYLCVCVCVCILIADLFCFIVENNTAL